MTADTPTSAPVSREVRRAETRARLLDSAEELWADLGYYGASVRDITDHAGSRVADVSDHFGGKENLYREVIVRRAQPINEDRLARLASIPKVGSRSKRVRALIEAFAAPLLVRSSESQGWRNYFRLLAQTANARQWVQLLIADQFNPIAQEFVAGLRAIYPDASDTAIHDAYLLMLAASMHTFSDNLRIDAMTDGRLQSGNFAERSASMLPFVAAGIDRIAGLRGPTRAS